MKQTRAVLSLLLVSGSLGLTLAYAEQDSPSRGGGDHITVNGIPISNTLIDLVTENQVTQGKTPGPQLEQQIKTNLIALSAVSQEAVKEGLDQDPKIRAQLEFTREQILMQALGSHYAKEHPIKDEELRAEYDQLKAALGNKEYLAEHILVADEATAQTIIAELDKGANFETLAKEKSIDTGSKDRGGKLDWAAPAVFDKSFADALVALKKGQTTQTPVHSRFGYHVIRLLDERPLQPPPFDSVKNRLSQDKEQQAFGQYAQQLVKNAKVTGQ